MYIKDIYVLIMFAKFQNSYTRIAPCTVAKFNSSLKIFHDTHGCHCNFTAWTLDLSWIGIKDATTGQNPHLVFKIQVLEKAWFLNSPFIFWPFQIIFTFFSPPVPFLLLPSLYIPISFSQPVTWLQKAH